MKDQLTSRGNRLHPQDRAHVLSAYIYRGTVENQAARPRAVMQTGSRLPLITDEQWLAVTDFNVKANGRLDMRSHYCHTHHHEIPEHKAILDAWAKANP